MERALVVLDSPDVTDSNKKLVREAGELAAGVDAELVVVSLVSDDELEDDLDTLSTIAEVERTDYNEQTILESTAHSAEKASAEVLSGVDVAVTGVASVFDEQKATAIMTVADEYDCDHVFISGRRRSPTGKAIFGDTTQAVLLNFDGHVTTAME